MARTYKGSKGPGWEPWSNLKERQEQRADYSEDDEEAYQQYLYFLRDLEKEDVDKTTIVNKSLWKISESEYLMGRDKQAPLDSAMRKNMEKLLIALNLIRDLYGKPMSVSSGYRPAAVNAATAGASKTSCHLTCEACDFKDTDRKLIQWLLRNMDILERAGLYMESPINTPTWVHLQTRAPRSGKRVFIA